MNNNEFTIEVKMSTNLENEDFKKPYSQISNPKTNINGINSQSYRRIDGQISR